MDYKPLADPFNITFEKEGIQYKAKVVYAKSATSCANLYYVEIETPEGIEPFCLKEKPLHNEGSETMLSQWWCDRYPREDFETRLSVVKDLRRITLQQAAHMMHHDQPEALARAVQEFLG